MIKQTNVYLLLVLLLNGFIKSSECTNITILPAGKYLMVRHDVMIDDSDDEGLFFQWKWIHSIHKPVKGLNRVYSIQTKHEVWDKSAYTVCDAITKKRLTYSCYGKDFAGKSTWIIGETQSQSKIL